MKAENILNSYLTSKDTICFEKFAEKLIFQKKFHSLEEIFFFVTQIFRIFLYTLFFSSSMSSTDDKVKLHEG